MLDITKPMWPDTLPGFNLGWKMGGLGSSVLRSSPERGPAKTRRTCSADIVTFSGSVLLDAQQYRIFLKWYHEDIADGALAFQWWDFVAFDWVYVRITSVEPENGDDPGHMTLDLTLEVLP